MSGIFVGLSTRRGPEDWARSDHLAFLVHGNVRSIAGKPPQERLIEPILDHPAFLRLDPEVKRCAAKMLRNHAAHKDRLLLFCLLLDREAFFQLGRGDQLALIRQINGVEASSPSRRTSLDRAWEPRRKELAQLIAKRSTTKNELCNFLHQPSQTVCFIEASPYYVHALITVGAALSWGQRASHGAGAPFTVSSPDPFVANGWPQHGAAAERIYTRTVFTISREEERALAQALENAAAKSLIGSSLITTARQMVEMMCRDRGHLERGWLRGGKIHQPAGSEQDSAAEELLSKYLETI